MRSSTSWVSASRSRRCLRAHAWAPRSLASLRPMPVRPRGTPVSSPSARDDCHFGFSARSAPDRSARCHRCRCVPVALPQIVRRQLDRGVNPCRLDLNGQETRDEDQKDARHQPLEAVSGGQLDQRHGDALQPVPPAPTTSSRPAHRTGPRVRRARARRRARSLRLLPVEPILGGRPHHQHRADHGQDHHDEYDEGECQNKSPSQQREERQHHNDCQRQPDRRPPEVGIARCEPGPPGTANASAEMMNRMPAPRKRNGILSRDSVNSMPDRTRNTAATTQTRTRR